jgi:hypothetical protein
MSVPRGSLEGLWRVPVSLAMVYLLGVAASLLLTRDLGDSLRFAIVPLAMVAVVFVLPALILQPLCARRIVQGIGDSGFQVRSWRLGMSGFGAADWALLETQAGSVRIDFGRFWIGLTIPAAGYRVRSRHPFTGWRTKGQRAGAQAVEALRRAGRPTQALRA